MKHTLFATLTVCGLLALGCESESRSPAPGPVPKIAFKTAATASKEIIIQMPTVQQKQNECRQTVTAFLQRTYGTHPPLASERWRFGWDYNIKPGSLISCLAGVELVTFRPSIYFSGLGEWSEPTVAESFHILDAATGRELGYAQQDIFAPRGTGGPAFQTVGAVERWYRDPTGAKSSRVVAASHQWFQTESRETIAKIVFGLRDRMFARSKSSNDPK